MNKGECMQEFVMGIQILGVALAALGNYTVNKRRGNKRKSSVALFFNDSSLV